MREERPTYEELEARLAVAERNAQDVATQSAREWRTTFDSMVNAVFLLDADCVIRRCNRAFRDLVDKPFNEIINQSCCDVVHGACDRPGFCPLDVARHSRKRESVTLPMGDQWRDIVVDPILDDNGQFIGAVHTISDVTTAVQVERTLRKERDIAQGYLDIVGTMIVALNVKGEVALINRRGCEILEYAQEEVLGKSWFDNFLPERLRAEVKAVSAKLLADEIEPVEYFENPVLTRSGEERLIAWHNTAVRDEDGAVIGHLSAGQDITELKRAEDEGLQLETQLRRAQKMEAIGRLAGGVAHDFNNILMGIEGFTQVVRDQLEPNSEPYEELGEVMELTTRAAELTQQLLAFSRRQPLQPQRVDLNNMVSHSAKMLQRLIGENIDLQASCVGALGYVKVDPGQMDQVLMNLAVNARDAMPQGGRLRIETSDIKIGSSGGNDAVKMRPGPYVLLTVADSGIGMDAATYQQVFDPFFTTKGVGKGTGLGLSTVYGIVKQHEGYIWIDSAPGVGTTFRIYLPRVDSGAKRTRRNSATAAGTRGKETLLVVEDEASVRLTLRYGLESLGYRVLLAASGQEAEALIPNELSGIDLMVSDVLLPDWPGPAAYERLAVQRPDLKVLFMSGYAEREILERAGIEDGTPFLQKPFLTSRLAEKIREVLDASVAV